MHSRLHSRAFSGVMAATLAVAVTAAIALALPARAHHSFAPYNMEVVKVFTGVVTRVNPGRNDFQRGHASVALRRACRRSCAGHAVVQMPGKEAAGGRQALRFRRREHDHRQRDVAGPQGVR
jgi:hypothetical protein